MYYLSPAVYAPSCCPVRVREQPSFRHLVDVLGHDMGLVLVDTLILYYPSLILFLKHKFMVYPGFCASVLVQWTCCPGAVNCNCCWVMLSPCPAPSLVGFFNFDIDTTMNTQHKLHISEWSGFCDQTSQFESAKTKYKHLSQILHSSQYRWIN